MGLLLGLASCVAPAEHVGEEAQNNDAEHALGAQASCGSLVLDPARSQAALDAAVTSLSLVGAQAAIVLCGVTWTGGAGYADLSTGRRLTGQEPFRAASTTKTFTAALLLQLAQEGTLGLDDPISRWFPTLPSATSITVRMLLANRSGYPSYSDDPLFRVMLLAEPARVWRPEELVFFGVRNPLLFAPGTSFSYSNTNFILAALIAQAVTGKSFATLLRERFLSPLGLSRTSLPPAETVPSTIARGITWALRLDGSIDPAYNSGAPRDATYLVNYSHAWAAGALVSTVRDEAVFLRAITRGNLLTPAARAAMMPTDASSDYPYGKYGLGMVRVPTSLGSYAYGHSGQTFGYQTWMLDLPTADLTVVVNVNDDHHGEATLNTLFDRVARSVVP